MVVKNKMYGSIQNKNNLEYLGKVKGNLKKSIDQNKIKQEQVMLPKSVSTNSALSIKVSLG